MPNNNGKVGIFGISYPGFYTSASIIDSHPALKAASPQAPMTDLVHGRRLPITTAPSCWRPTSASIPRFGPAEIRRRCRRHRGRFDYGTPDGYEFFLQHLTAAEHRGDAVEEQRAFWMPIIEHPTYDDFWQVAQHRART